MTLRIDSFRGEYRWLSNFHLTPICYRNQVYPSSENAYQAAKCLNPDDVEFFTTCTPRESKARGKEVISRPDWDKVKFSIMTNILEIKFSDPVLRKMLDDTGNVEIIEGNTWGDTYWGVCDGVGQNNLGKILMSIREQNRWTL